MQDLDKALADIVAIRSQIARDTAFRGLGAATVAGTGGLALACAAGQALWLGVAMDLPELPPPLECDESMAASELATCKANATANEAFAIFATFFPPAVSIFTTSS